MVKVAKIKIYLEREGEEKEGRIEFTVLDKDTNSPVQGAKVRVWREDTDWEYEGYTDAYGQLVIDNVEVATYKYEITKQGYEPYRSTITPDMFR